MKMPRAATVTLLCSITLACAGLLAARLSAPFPTSVGSEVAQQLAAKVGLPAKSWSVKWTEGEKLDWLREAAHRSGATSAREELDCSAAPYWEYALSNEPLSAKPVESIAFIRHEHGLVYTVSDQ